MNDPSKVNEKAMAQAAWASQSISIDDLYKVIKDCLVETKPFFDDIKEPNRTQMSIMGKLQEIEKTINQEK